MSKYGWIVTWQNPEVFEDYDPHTPDVIGPRNILESVMFRLKNGEGEPFVMKDDDGEEYYHGKVIRLDPDNDELLFAPLDDYGEPNAGCTSIEYMNDRGEWEVL